MTPDSQKQCQSVKQCKSLSKWTYGVCNGFLRKYHINEKKGDGKAKAKSISLATHEFLLM